MKQGQASHSSLGATKVEPKSHAVSPEAAASVGRVEGRATSLPLYEGRGLEAPMKSTTSHPKGSQGTH